MVSTQQYEHERNEKHQRERKELEMLRDTMRRRASTIESPKPEDRLGYDPMIFPGLYAPSGFNIMDILIAIRKRPMPTLSIGAIDGAVSLLLCDMTLADMPIVYCTETFQKLVGYPESEILGRNCRFLQYPPRGLTNRAGSTTDDVVGLSELQNADTSTDIESQIIIQNNFARMALSECIANSVEGQANFINYRYNGERFRNLITVIPIKSEGRDYFVGLQADLGPVEGL